MVRNVSLTLAFALLASCGGGAGDGGAPVTVPTTPAPAPAPAPTPSATPSPAPSPTPNSGRYLSFVNSKSGVIPTSACERTVRAGRDETYTVVIPQGDPGLLPNNGVGLGAAYDLSEGSLSIQFDQYSKADKFYESDVVSSSFLSKVYRKKSVTVLGTDDEVHLENSTFGAEFSRTVKAFNGYDVVRCIMGSPTKKDDVPLSGTFVSRNLEIRGFTVQRENGVIKKYTLSGSGSMTVDAVDAVFTVEYNLTGVGNDGLRKDFGRIKHVMQLTQSDNIDFNNGVTLPSLPSGGVAKGTLYGPQGKEFGVLVSGGSESSDAVYLFTIHGSR